MLLARNVKPLRADHNFTDRLAMTVHSSRFGLVDMIEVKDPDHPSTTRIILKEAVTFPRWQLPNGHVGRLRIGGQRRKTFIFRCSCGYKWSGIARELVIAPSDLTAAVRSGSPTRGVALATPRSCVYGPPVTAPGVWRSRDVGTLRLLASIVRPTPRSTENDGLTQG